MQITKFNLNLPKIKYRIKHNNLLTMPTQKEKELLIRLIKDDLINYKLVSTLNELGLHADSYLLGLSDTIFNLMHFPNDKSGDEVYEHYLKLTREVKHINIVQSPEQLHHLAHQIYAELIALQSKVNALQA